ARRRGGRRAGQRYGRLLVSGAGHCATRTGGTHPWPDAWFRRLAGVGAGGTCGLGLGRADPGRRAVALAAVARGTARALATGFGGIMPVVRAARVGAGLDWGGLTKKCSQLPRDAATM